MKIVLLVSSLGSGGAERVAATLCNAWAERGDQVTLIPTFSGRGDCFYELSPNVSVVYLADRVSSRKKTLGNQISRLMALRNSIAADRPGVIVSFLSNVNVAAVLASVGLGIPVVVCERTDPFIFPTPMMLKLAMRVAYPFADALVVQTQDVASKYQSAKCYLQKIIVIPNPIPQNLFGILRNKVRSDDKKCLLAMGRLAEEKQFGLLIKVFARLAYRFPSWSLRVIGEGPLRDELQKQIDDLGLNGQVELPGRFSNISEELAKVDAFALTSKVEGFPNAMLEAMAVGLPCVAFDCPSGPRELSSTGQVALLVPQNDEVALEDELCRLMSDEGLRASLGRLAQSSVIARYSVGKVLERWDELFIGLISKK